jgi:hypothetical protein
MFQNKERSCLLVGERNREESQGVFGLRRIVAESFRKPNGLSGFKMQLIVKIVSIIYQNDLFVTG